VIRQYAREQVRHRLSPDGRREARWWLQARRKALRGRSGLVHGVAILWTAGGRCELAPREVALAGRGEVTVELVFTAVSPGTERAQFVRLPNAQVALPYTPGYSGAGVVRAVGAGVRHLVPGDRVAVIRAPHASVATIPASDAFLVPEGVGLESASLIRLGIICAQGVRKARMSVDEPFCVLGAGQIGLLTQRLALAENAGPATVIARTRRRETAARAGGATHFLTEDDVDAVAALGTQVVVEATGDPQSLALAVAAAAPRARIVLLGSSRGVTSDVPLDSIRAKELELIGGHVSTLRLEAERSGEDLETREANRFLGALADGRLDVRDLVGEMIDPRESGLFYRRLASSNGPAAACFDWFRIPSQQRIGRSRMLRVPDLSGRGVDSRTPVRGRASGGAQGDRDDPFRDAAGMLRVGLIGCGDIAFRNAAAIVAAPNTKLVACYDTVPELAVNLAASFDCDVAPTAHALIERADIDAVFLAVPHHLHAPLALDVISRGRHVLVEKPPANDLAGAVAMARAAEDAGVALTVCFPHRFGANVACAKRLIDSGAIGAFGGAGLSFFSDKPASYWLGGFSGRAISDWRSSPQKAGGGVLIMNLSHHVDLLRYLSDQEVASVMSTAATVDDEAAVEDTVSIGIRYENGAIGSVLGCSATRGIAGDTDLRLWGSDGQIIVEPDLRVFTLRHLDAPRNGRWYRPEPLPRRDPRAVFVSRFATAVTTGAPCDVDGADAIAVQAVIEAAYASAASGRAVDPSTLVREAAS
jgi:predicted dehydrogenase/NADPH:quinone reductase-like Zn-dependent oxidoreductase